MSAMAFAVLAVVLTVLMARLRKEKAREAPGARRPLTAPEQKMYFRLRDALPDLVVLAQVSFGALLTARSKGVRNTFSQKVADFVICDRAFNVVAVIELDDRSHDGRAGADQARDALLEGAGYRVLRWRGIPDLDHVRSAFAALPGPPA